MQHKNYTEEEFIKAVASSPSRRQVMLKIGIAPLGNNYTTVNNLIKKLNLDISHFTGQRSNLGRTFGPKRPIEDYLSNQISITTHKLKKRLINEDLLKPICSTCKLTSWLENPIPLELDHIDGNRDNNNLDNLRLLCPNCHTLTPTYKGKNIKTTNIHKCKNCKGPTHSSWVTYCKNCYVPPTKIEWPSNKELEELIKEHNYNITKVGNILGISDNGVRRRANKSGINIPKRYRQSKK